MTEGPVTSGVVVVDGGGGGASAVGVAGASPSTAPAVLLGPGDDESS